MIHSGQHVWSPSSLAKLAESVSLVGAEWSETAIYCCKVQSALAAKLETKYVGLIESCTHLKFTITRFMDGPVERLRNMCNKLWPLALLTVNRCLIFL